MRIVRWLLLIALIGAGPLWAGDTHEDHRELFGLSLTEGWLDPTVHSHLSPRGTPYIHPFRIEPAFTRRDLLLDYSYHNTADEDEQEVEAELEWAFTRRLGLVLEVPYVCLSGDEDSGSGFANLAVSPRVLLAEYERFLLAFSFEVEAPTGETKHDIAEDETAIAPSFSTWMDLGDWWVVNSQFGVEHGTESNDSELFLRTSLGHTLATQNGSDAHHAHGLPPGFLSVILEADLAVGLSGEEDGDWTAEGLLGVYYGLRENLDVRAAYVFPLSASQELDGGLTAGLIQHF